MATSRPSFPYVRDPLHPEQWPSWQLPVNRDRIYDFYSQGGGLFLEASERPTALATFPGLDGGRHGHWGNQNETIWADDRWNRTDLGTVQSGVFHAGT